MFPKLQSVNAYFFATLSVSEDERKRRASSGKANERKTAGKEKRRACKHLFKYLDPPTIPPTSRKTVYCVKMRYLGGSVINTRAFSWDKVSVITFSIVTRWLRNFAKEQQISFGNNTKYSDFIDGKYFLRN